MTTRNTYQRHRALNLASQSTAGPSDQFLLAIAGVETLLDRKALLTGSDGGWPKRPIDASHAKRRSRPKVVGQEATGTASDEASAYLSQVAELRRFEELSGRAGCANLIMPCFPLDEGHDQHPLINEVADEGSGDKTTTFKAFARLPLELNQLIMTHLSEPRSLRAAALSCRALYYAVVTAEESLATLLILKEIPPELVPEAFLALEASHSCQAGTLESNTEFSNKYLRQRQTGLPRRVSLAEAVDMSTRYGHVDHFTKTFHRYALQDLVLPFSPPPGYPYGMGTMCWQPVDRKKMPLVDCFGLPTPAEYARIARALYRFEIYCIMFKDRPNFRSRSFRQDNQAELFFNRFSLVENEQLASVMDFLACAIVGPPLKYACEKQLSWKRHFENTDPLYDEATSEACSFQYRILSLGLDFLHKVESTSKRDFHELLELPNRYELGDTMFLHHALNFCANDHLQTVAPATPTGPRSFFQDDDTGPRTPWRWVTTNGMTRGPYRVNASYLRGCRRAGYVFWDQRRIATLDHRHLWHGVCSAQASIEADLQTWRRMSFLDTIDIWYDIVKRH